MTAAHNMEELDLAVLRRCLVALGMLLMYAVG